MYVFAKSFWEKLRKNALKTRYVCNFNRLNDITINLDIVRLNQNFGKRNFND